MSNPVSLKIAVLISGSGSNLQAIIDAISANTLQAEITVVISNRPGVKGLERAKAAGIASITLDHTQYPSRELFDQQLIQNIQKYPPDLIVLAGFMRILSDNFIEHFRDRILNIHPSLLPEFKGLNTHQRALDAHKNLHGVSVHYVSNELDGGPVILQAIIKLQDNDTASTLQQRIQVEEHIIYPMAIEWIAQGRLAIINQQVYLDNKALEKPLKWVNKQLIK